MQVEGTTKKSFWAYYPVYLGSIMCLCKTDLPTPQRSSRVCTPLTRASAAEPVTLAGIEPGPPEWQPQRSTAEPVRASGTGTDNTLVHYPCKSSIHCLC